jgi:hypothetical protein
MARNEARLTLVCDGPRILKLFEVCRLADVLRIVSSRDDLNTGGIWNGEDDERSARLEAWLERYAASSG